MIYRDLFFTYFPEILGGLYFDMGLRLVKESKYPIDVRDIKSICIFGTSGIGNLIMLTPMIRTLRNGIPDAKISVVVLPNGAEYVLKDSDLVNDIIIYDSKKVLREIRHRWYDLTIASTHRGFMRAKEAFRTGAFWRIGFRYDYKGKKNTSFLFTHAVPYDENKHEVEQGLDLIRSLGLPEIRKLYMHVSEKDEEEAEEILQEANINKNKPIFGIYTGLDPDHPKGRCISLDKFAKLGDILSSNYGAEIIIVGSSEETPTAVKIADMMINKPKILTGKTTLRQVASIIKRCDLFVSSDGGPMHIAAAMGVPVVGIFGPTDWVSHAPYSKRSRIVKSNMECAPCHKAHGEGVKCTNQECLKSITIDDIMEAVSSMID